MSESRFDAHAIAALNSRIAALEQRLKDAEQSRERAIRDAARLETQLREALDSKCTLEARLYECERR